MIYLASPYTHEHSWVRRERYEEACRAAARYMEMGHYIYSPIAHTHGICLAMGEGDRIPFEFWERYDYHMIDLADELWVLRLPGWLHSKGVKAEIEYALSKGKPVIHKEYPGE